MNFVNIKYWENEQSALFNKDESKEEIIKNSPKKLNSESFGSENKNKENHHNDENKNSKNTPSSIQVLSSVINEFSPKKSNTFGNYLISPIKDLKFRENAFTPLKNDSRSYSYSPSIKFEMKTESPFDRINQSSAKISYQIPQTVSPRIIQGKRINFNNIDQINNHNTNINININYNIESQNQLDKHNKYKYNNQSFANNQYSSKHNLFIKNKHINNNIEQNKLICTCTKTNCKKKYCACYANGRYCEGCQCENCENQMPINKNIPIHEINGLNVTNIVCNCTKSNCRKKYCECYKGGKECSWMCRCVNCENCISKTIRSNLFQIEAVGIEIHDNIMYIRTRNVIENDKEKCDSKEEIFTPVKLCNKKRERTKTAEATTNMKTINIHSTSQKTCSNNKNEILKEKGNVTRKRLLI